MKRTAIILASLALLGGLIFAAGPGAGRDEVREPHARRGSRAITPRPTRR